ncbi:MAG: hypothetical protein WAR21_00045 [Candidatus Acidiferrales bacterium]|jgi:hypothetical protein
MNKRIPILLTAFALLLLAPLAALAQQQEEPPTFTYVSEWAVPRAQWADWVAYAEKNTKPIFDKLLADGTIISWGTYVTIVHDESGITHGLWFEASSIAGIERVLGETIKVYTAPLISTATKHRDYLLRSPLRRSKAASGANGYLWVSANQVQPGKGQEWREMFDKYSKPVYDELLANGTILAYWIDVEQVHTDNPGWRYVVYLTPNADALAKVSAAFEAAAQKRGADANRGISRSFADITVAGVHRDYLARVTSYAQK